MDRITFAILWTALMFFVLGYSLGYNIGWSKGWNQWLVKPKKK
jgi:hypothetical protein